MVPAGRFEGAAVDEESIAKRYEENMAGYMSPEEVRLRFVVLSRDALAAEVEVPPGTLEEFYETRKAGLSVPEQRRLRHILIADEEGEDAARVEAEALRARILAGEAFEDIAREASDDPGSAGSGGDLGFSGRGVWVPPFEEAAFSLPVGELSEPVRSEFGFHLIRVEDVRESRTPTFEEAAADLEQEYRGEQAEQLYFEQVERLANLAFEQPDNLDDAAEDLGLSVIESDYISRGGVPGDEVLSDRGVIAAAFDEDVLAGNNSEPVEIDGYRTVVLRVEGRREPRQLGLDEVRDAIAESLGIEQARESARELGVDLLARLRAGEAMDAVVFEDLAWSEERTAGRREADIEPPVREVLFSMPRPGSDEMVFDGVTVANGDFVVLALGAVDESEPEAEAFSEMRDRLSQQLGLDAHDFFVAGLRERAEVRIFEDRISADGFADNR